jgi:hypothetical protein
MISSVLDKFEFQWDRDVEVQEFAGPFTSRPQNDLPTCLADLETPSVNTVRNPETIRSKFRNSLLCPTHNSDKKHKQERSVFWEATKQISS